MGIQTSFADKQSTNLGYLKIKEKIQPMFYSINLGLLKVKEENAAHVLKYKFWPQIRPNFYIINSGDPKFGNPGNDPTRDLHPTGLFCCVPLKLINVP